MPSAPQNRPGANGRSADTHSTTVSSRPAARSLNVRTLVAHVGVSMLGKMLSMTFLPARSAASDVAEIGADQREGGCRCADIGEIAGRVDGVTAEGDFSHEPNL